MNPAESDAPTVAELAEALAQRQFVLHCQPIVELHGNRVICEAVSESEPSCDQ